MDLSGNNPSAIGDVFHQFLIDQQKHFLRADGLLIIGLQRPTDTDIDLKGQVFLKMIVENVEVVDMIGIIHKLQTDVNKHFADEGLDVPFPDARPYVRPIGDPALPPTEG